MANETTIDLDAIRKRALDFFGLYHPTAGPCRCGSCNPVAHTGHPLHAAMSEVRRDHNALLAEVERLRLTMQFGFQCPECGYRFNDQGQLSLHLARPGGCPNRTVIGLRE